jgi:protein SCO1/2
VKRAVVFVVSGLALLALVLAGCSSSGSPKPKKSQLLGQNSVGPYQGAGLDPAQPRPSFTLTDTVGKPFAFGTKTSGHPTFLYFGYTHCPDVCPETMADIGLALRKVPSSLRAKTYVVFVTTDVKRDSEHRIGTWLRQFAVGTKATWVGLRGTQAQINAAQAAAHISLATDGGETHSLEVLLYGPDDYAHVAFLLSKEQSKQIAHDLAIVGSQSA